jgi:arginase
MSEADGRFGAADGRRRVSLLGIPLELGASQPGAVMGPAALRTAGIVPLIADLGYSVSDQGDLRAPPGVDRDGTAISSCHNFSAIAAWTQAIHDRAYAIMATGAVPVFLGGDHTISMGTISAIARHCAQARRELIVLWLDAHADFNTPETSPSGNMHGMSLAFISGEPSLRMILDRPFVPVAAQNIHLFGLRSIDAGERHALRTRGVNAIDMRMIDEFGVSVLVRQIVHQMTSSNAHLHVSLDVDFLDPSLAPGVGTAVPGGATYREAHLIMELLHDSGLVGSLDLVELNPFLDVRGQSARLLAELTASLFGRTIIDSPALRSERP